MAEILTQTELATFSRCEQRHNIRYNKWLVPFTEHPALSMGSAFHAGIEGGNAQSAYGYLDKLDPVWPQWEEDSSQKRRATVGAMVGAALKFWTEWPDEHEIQFNLPLKNPYTGNSSKRHRISGVWDGVWNGTHPLYPGETVLGEWKTASVVNNDYMQRLEIDFQVSAYLWAASRRYGRPVNKVIYRVVKKPTIRQRKNESVFEYVERLFEDYEERPEHYLFSAVVTRTPEQLKDWHEQAWAVHKRLLEIKRGDVPAIKNTQSCISRGRCPYFDLCTGEVTEDAFKKLDTKHREIRR
jgi:hypothetical protein